MKTIKVKNDSDIPKNFTGKVEYENGSILYILNGMWHRLDGPAIIWPNGYKAYYINGKFICDLGEKDHEQFFYNSKEYKQATGKNTNSEVSLPITEDMNTATKELSTASVKSDYEQMAEKIGKLVTEKNKAYGNSFEIANKFLMLLFPNGIAVENYSDVLCIVRIFDKLKRIATDKNAYEENPFLDLAGYAILGAVNDKRNKDNKE